MNKQMQITKCLNEGGNGNRRMEAQLNETCYSDVENSWNMKKDRVLCDTAVYASNFDSLHILDSDKIGYGE